MIIIKTRFFDLLRGRVSYFIRFTIPIIRQLFFHYPLFLQWKTRKIFFFASFLHRYFPSRKVFLIPSVTRQFITRWTGFRFCTAIQGIFIQLKRPLPVAMWRVMPNIWTQRRMLICLIWTKKIFSIFIMTTTIGSYNQPKQRFWRVKKSHLLVNWHPLSINRTESRCWRFFIKRLPIFGRQMPKILAFALIQF